MCDTRWINIFDWYIWIVLWISRLHSQQGRVWAQKLKLSPVLYDGKKMRQQSAEWYVRYKSNNSVGKCNKPLKLLTDHQSEESEPPQWVWGVIIVFSSSPAKYSTTLLVSQQGQRSNQVKIVSNLLDECLTAVTKGGYLPFICFPSLDPKWCKLESEQWSDIWPIFARFPPFCSWTQKSKDVMEQST